MFSHLFQFFLDVDAFFWGYIGFFIISAFGCYLTIKTGLFQIRAFPLVVQTFAQEILQKNDQDRGLKPIKAFFASIGGMLGVGNIVSIVTAIQLGGPGALFWVWLAGFIGTLIKYAEIYLGLKYRVQNTYGGYDGGPMYFLKKAFAVRWVPMLICVLLCIYGAEIYQFNVVVDTLTYSWGFNRMFIALGLLGLVLYTSIGGASRAAEVCCWVMPFFMIVYMSLCLWVIFSHFSELPSIFSMVMHAAFDGHAAIGGFAGSSMLMAIQNGMAGACYASDIGIGYDSIIQSESHTIYPERQARMAFFGVVLNNLICTLSILVVLVTGLWSLPLTGEGAPLVQLALAQYFPWISMIMPVFICILGYTTLVSFLIVGIKCARYLHPEKGARLYLIYSVCVFIFFAFFDQTVALLVMRAAGAFLLTINLAGIFRLIGEVEFSFEDLLLKDHYEHS
ncbi:MULTISPECIES: amino acid carrier protein [Parachlamydia]|jgi:AGCS family alanine or glycine:cation symporter|uniref:amino acid carrier protein n=1 Tax=Parachlamydia TaxID=83551 RepID=UPI0024E224F9|nr:amino acid carrier protein [Parachlamydia acanthamoebae]